jgi:holo-[acyl-carrier protein] synthase
MILGIGTDLIDIRRIEQSLDRFGERFIARVFTAEEQKRAERRRPDGGNVTRSATYAKRFAAKEACAKALGTGLRKGVFLKDMGVINLPSGQPTLQLTGGALDRLQAMTPPGMVARIHLALTDELPWAQAFVVISAEAVQADPVSVPSTIFPSQDA